MKSKIKPRKTEKFSEIQFLKWSMDAGGFVVSLRTPLLIYSCTDKSVRRSFMVYINILFFLVDAAIIYYQI